MARVFSPKDVQVITGITARRNELPRRKQRGINEGSDRFSVASDGVLNPMLRNKASTPISR